MTHIWITELFSSWKGLLMSSWPPTHCGNFLSNVYPDNTWMPPMMEHSFSSSSINKFYNWTLLESERRFCIFWANGPLFNFYVLAYAVFLRGTQNEPAAPSLDSFSESQIALTSLWRTFSFKLVVSSPHNNCGVTPVLDLDHPIRQSKVFWARVPPTG